MIYTCTISPSLDYFMEFDSLEFGVVNRSKKEYFEAGGKGINVSVVLNNLKVPSRAIGFVGGFTKDYFLEKIASYENIEPSFTYIEGNTRINVKALSNLETTMNASGPHISEKEALQLLKRIERLTSFDTLVLSGSVPKNCYGIVRKMIEICNNNNVSIVLDTNPDLMYEFLSYGPVLVKPNLEELEEMFDTVISSDDDVVLYGKKVVELGAEHCIVTLGAQGALLFNKDGVLRSNAKSTASVKTVGAGDSVVAGFIMSYNRSKDIDQIFRYASACGVATVHSSKLATKEEVESIIDKIKIEKL